MAQCFVHKTVDLLEMILRTMDEHTSQHGSVIAYLSLIKGAEDIRGRTNE